MKFCDLAPSYVRAIAPYQPGKPISELAREFGLDERGIVKLASNENPLGPSPKAIEAIRGLLQGLSQYPDGNGYEFKSALMAKLGVAREQIVLGNGSNDVLAMIADAFLSRDDSAIFSQHAFAVYPLAVQAVGAQGIEVPARNYGHDLPAMRAAIKSNTRVVFIANPNNPTGTFADEQAVLSFLESVPAEVVVVLDEAYGEYLPQALRMDSVAWLKRFPNLIITRTLSKAYGLAGLRVGYGLAHPEAADLMNRVRQPFNVNSLALAAATAALDDAAFLAESFRMNQSGMRQLVEGFKRLELEHIESLGNFVSVRVGDAPRIYQSLLRQGVIVRPVASYGMPEHLRVTVGREAQNERFLGALEQSLSAHR
jgi:histidinol-phosphate aminotransferase